MDVKFFVNHNRICLEKNHKIRLSDLVEKEQIYYITYDIGISQDCLCNHIDVSYFEEYECSILSGDPIYSCCGMIDNLLLDHKTFTIHNLSFVHMVTISENDNSPAPVLIFMLMYVSGKWLIVSYGSVLNELIFYNGKTFEDIFYESWGYNRLSSLPRNQCHIFLKSSKSIAENTRNDLTYIISYYKSDHFCYVNSRLKSMFPSVCDDVDLRFSYHTVSLMEEKETWNVINNFKKRTITREVKRLSFISDMKLSVLESITS